MLHKILNFCFIFYQDMFLNKQATKSYQQHEKTNNVEKNKLNHLKKLTILSF